MKKNKPTLALLFLSVFYIGACCFVFQLISDMAIDLLFSDKVSFNQRTLKKIGFMSLIVGMAVGIGGYVFAKIDERKARKSPPSDPE